jgi:hypothetical protein
MHRYIDQSDYRAPFDSPQLDMAGLGRVREATAEPTTEWPTARRYFDVSDLRAPYDNGYYQDGSLMGDEEQATAATAYDGVRAGCPSGLRLINRNGQYVCANQAGKLDLAAPLFVCDRTGQELAASQGDNGYYPDPAAQRRCNAPDRAKEAFTMGAIALATLAGIYLVGKLASMSPAERRRLL